MLRHLPDRALDLRQLICPLVILRKKSSLVRELRTAEIGRQDREVIRHRLREVLAELQRLDGHDP